MMKIFACFFLCSSFSFAQTQEFFPLPDLHLNSEHITVSGLSSGAFMAVQLQVAYADVFSGAGSLAGGAFYCAEGDPIKAQTACMANPQALDMNRIFEEVRAQESKGKIAPTSLLKNQKIYIFQGSKDSTVRTESALRLHDFFTKYGSKTSLRLEIPAEHGFPTLEKGQACDQKGLPWINNCGFDAAGEMLAYLLSDIRSLERSSALHFNLMPFSQKEFSTLGDGLDELGYLYIPASCRGQTNRDCLLHVALHGCRQNPEFVKEKFIQDAGYLEWSEKNRIVILFPSTHSSEVNPKACWDWFGYTGSDYHLRSSKQMRAIVSMVKRLTGQKVESNR